VKPSDSVEDASIEPEGQTDAVDDAEEGTLVVAGLVAVARIPPLGVVAPAALAVVDASKAHKLASDYSYECRRTPLTCLLESFLIWRLTEALVVLS